MSDKCVCSSCMHEPGFEKLIHKFGEEDICSFCQKKAKCLPLDVIMDHFVECSNEQYKNPKLPWENPGVIIWYFLGEFKYSGTLIDALIEKMGEKIENLNNPPELFYYNWQHFSKHIQHHKRFFFSKDLRFIDEPVIGGPLSLIKDTFRFCKEFLIDEISPGQKIYRCRFDPDGTIGEKFEDFLAPPPCKSTMSNRMSPPGIPYLYCSDTQETALAETVKEKGKYKTAEFNVLKPMKIIGLTKIPEPASLFDPDEDKRKERNKILFLKIFAREISKPVERNDRTHIDYVPSQIISEYMRDQFQEGFGIMYASAHNPKGRNIAFFPYRESFPKDFLELVNIVEKIS